MFTIPMESYSLTVTAINLHIYHLQSLSETYFNSKQLWASHDYLGPQFLVSIFTLAWKTVGLDALNLTSRRKSGQIQRELLSRIVLSIDLVPSLCISSNSLD